MSDSTILKEAIPLDEVNKLFEFIGKNSYRFETTTKGDRWQDVEVTMKMSGLFSFLREYGNHVLSESSSHGGLRYDRKKND